MIVYVCTVGTGTAGETSNVSEGIAAAIKFRNPEHCRLLPSASEESVAVAQIIQENVARTGISIAETDIIPLTSHDDILRCRHIRACQESQANHCRQCLKI